jgi:hypothetical protein
MSIAAGFFVVLGGKADYTSGTIIYIVAKSMRLPGIRGHTPLVESVGSDVIEQIDE